MFLVIKKAARADSSAESSLKRRKTPSLPRQQTAPAKTSCESANSSTVAGAKGRRRRSGETSPDHRRRRRTTSDALGPASATASDSEPYTVVTNQLFGSSSRTSSIGDRPSSFPSILRILEDNDDEYQEGVNSDGMLSLMHSPPGSIGNLPMTMMMMNNSNNAPHPPHTTITDSPIDTHRFRRALGTRADSLRDFEDAPPGRSRLRSVRSMTTMPDLPLASPPPSTPISGPLLPDFSLPPLLFDRNLYVQCGSELEAFLRYVTLAPMEKLHSIKSLNIVFQSHQDVEGSSCAASFFSAAFNALFAVKLGAQSLFTNHHPHLLPSFFPESETQSQYLIAFGYLLRMSLSSPGRPFVPYQLSPLLLRLMIEPSLLQDYIRYYESNSSHLKPDSIAILEQQILDSQPLLADLFPQLDRFVFEKGPWQQPPQHVLQQSGPLFHHMHGQFLEVLRQFEITEVDLATTLPVLNQECLQRFKQAVMIRVLHRLQSVMATITLGFGSDKILELRLDADLYSDILLTLTLAKPITGNAIVSALSVESRGLVHTPDCCDFADCVLDSLQEAVNRFATCFGEEGCRKLLVFITGSPYLDAKGKIGVHLCTCASLFHDDTSIRAVAAHFTSCSQSIMFPTSVMAYLRSQKQRGGLSTEAMEQLFSLLVSCISDPTIHFDIF